MLKVGRYFRLSSRLRDRRGAAAALMAVMFVAMLGVMAVAIDVIRLMSTRAELQTAVDAAALAGAVELSIGGGDNARPVAIDYALRNFAEAEPVVVAPEDVVFGDWDPETSTFTPLPGAAGADAVHVRARKQVTNWVAWALNVLTASPVAEAIAWAEAPVAETNCVKPWAIPEELLEVYRDGVVEPWEVEMKQGTEFTLKSATGGAADTLGASGIPSFFYPVILPKFYTCEVAASGPSGCQQGHYEDVQGGAAVYRENIATCNGEDIGPRDSLMVEPGNMPGPTVQGARELCDRIIDTYCYGPDGPGVLVIAAFWDSERDPIGRRSVEVTRLGSFRLDRVYSEGQHGVVKGTFMEMATPGSVGTVATNIQRPILVR